MQIHTRGSGHQLENEKLTDGTFEEIQNQTLTCDWEKNFSIVHV